MRYRELGHSTLGAPLIALAISSPQNRGPWTATAR